MTPSETLSRRDGDSELKARDEDGKAHVPKLMLTQTLQYPKDSDKSRNGITSVHDGAKTNLHASM